MLFNFGKDKYKVTQGDRVAQIILENYVSAPISKVNRLPQTDRGSHGFGSTDTPRNTKLTQFLTHILFQTMMTSRHPII